MKREVSVFNMVGRETPTSMISELVKHIEQSGVVDYYSTFDNLTGWWPYQLWREFAPNADLAPDCDSYYDPAFVLGLAAAHTDHLGLAMNATNATRNGPAEVLRLALTLAEVRPEKSFLVVGGGESYTISPFGYKRSTSIRRLEDHFKLYSLMLDCDQPFDYQGKEISFNKAYLGTIRPNKPAIWSVGAGPRLLDLSTTYADGNVAVAPCVYRTPEEYAAFVTATKQELERKGRDPEAFGFGLEFGVMLHPDASLIDEAFDNPLMKIYAAAYGRFNQSNWEKEGLTSVFPRDWTYHLHWEPNRQSPEQLNDILSRVPREMVERTFTGLRGTPHEVSATISAYYDAGMTLACPADLMPMFVKPDLEAPMASVERTIQLAAALKAAAPTGTARS